MKSLKFSLVLLLVLLVAASLGFAGGGQEEAEKARVEIEHWTHWCSNNEVYEPFWETAAEKFNTEHPEVDFAIKLNCVPYEGYEAKYSSAFKAGMGPGLFNGMTHVWVGQYDACDPMPNDIAAKLDKILVGAAKPYGVAEGKRYGLPVEGGNFMMLYYSVDLFKKAGLSPDKPPKTYNEMLEYAQKMTKKDSAGNLTQIGFGVRYAGHPFGIADKSAPFFNAWGAKWLSWEEKKASGYINSPNGVEALQFYGDLVQKYEVSSLELGKPVAVLSQGLAGMIFRESWLVGWMKQNAPDLNYRVAPLPSQKMESGFGNNFPWAINVGKHLPETEKKWIWEFFRWYVNSPEIRKEHYVKSNMFPPFNDILDDPIFSARPDFEAWKIMSSGRAAPTYYVPPAHEVLTKVGEAVLEVMFGKATAKTALDKAAKEIDAILAKY